MATVHALPLLVVLVTFLMSWPARAQSPRPAAEPPPRAEATSSPARAGEARVNINSADVRELMTLAGVGRKVAKRIVAHREAHGPFKKPDDLRKVDGVTEALWEKNRARIAVR